MAQTRYYRSKIGRLPHKIRTELNERIRDGATGTAILSWLNGLPDMTSVRAETGCEDVNAQNLTDWRTSGYADWLNEQDKTERIRSLASLSESIVLQAGGDPAAVGSRVLMGKMLETLENADLCTQGELAKAFSMLRAGEADSQRIALAKEKNEISRQALALDRAKFQRTTCELFLKWYEDEQAKSVVEDKSLNNDAKTEALGRLMFRDLWDSK